nr:MAG TPA: hypothetical protein [Microviridae sp.]
MRNPQTTSTRVLTALGIVGEYQPQADMFEPESPNAESANHIHKSINRVRDCRRVSAAG